MHNGKGKEVYCSAKKVSDHEIDAIRDIDRKTLEDVGFTFIKFISLEVEGVRGYAIFYEGHLDDMSRTLRALQKGY
jgi:hypothetical protein